MKKQTFSQRRLGYNGRSEKNIFKRILRAIGRFFASRKGIWTIALLLLLGSMLWVYATLGPLRVLFPHLPKLGGLLSSQQYLLLLQNENELRPTGGFITSFAVVNVRMGVPEIMFYGSEDVAIPEPQIGAPAAIERVMSRDAKYAGWVFRDTNFSLDFAQNAQTALDFLQFDERFADTEFDGVVAIDLHFLEDVLDVVGGISFEETTITSRNLFETLEFRAKNFDHHDLEAWQNRKSVLQPLAQQLLEQILSHPSRWKEMANVVSANADEKHLQLYFTDPELQQIAAQHNWTNTLPTEPFYSLNIANLGGRKGDRFLRQYAHSSLSIDSDGAMTETFTLLLEHEGTYNLQSDRYEAFVRLVHPADVIYTGSSGSFETPPQQAPQPYGAETSFFIVLNPGEQKLLTLEFEYPETYSFVTSDVLPILVLKQAGTTTPEWHFTLRAKNDPRFTATGCDTVRERENILFCDVQLQTDKHIVIEKHPDNTPPLLQFARFTGNASAQIRFSEDIFPEITPEQIQLQDLDGINQATDTIQITAVSVDENEIFIEFTGMSAVEGERYLLQIDGLKDVYGNLFAGEIEGLFQATIVQQ